MLSKANPSRRKRRWEGLVLKPLLTRQPSAAPACHLIFATQHANQTPVHLCLSGQSAALSKPFSVAQVLCCVRRGVTKLPTNLCAALLPFQGASVGLVQWAKSLKLQFIKQKSKTHAPYFTSWQRSRNKLYCSYYYRPILKLNKCWSTTNPFHFHSCPHHVWHVCSTLIKWCNRTHYTLNNLEILQRTDRSSLSKEKRSTHKTPGMCSRT